MNNKLREWYHIIRRRIRIIRGLEPDVKRQLQLSQVHHGPDFGGWSLCPDFLSPEPIVYSAGIGRDIEFDLSMIDAYEAQVFAFDPTPRSVEWINRQKLPENFKAYPLGIADYDGTAQVHPPDNPSHVSYSMKTGSKPTTKVKVRRIPTLMSELNHTSIDVLKLDIEGSEYGVIADILSNNIKVKQLLVEFHHRFDRLEVNDTIQIIDELNKNKYMISYISPNGREYTFVNTMNR